MMRILKLTFLAASTVYTFSLIALYIDSHRHYADKGEFAVVYGNKIELNGLPSERLKARLEAAVDLYLNQKVKNIIVSGGIGKEGFDEAAVMADYLMSRGVVKTDIVIDSYGYNTSLTSLNTRKIVKSDVCVVAVTQQYHVSRAKLSLHNAGFTCVLGYFPSYFEFRDIYSWNREIPAWVKYWVTKS